MAVGMACGVLLPEQLSRYPAALEFPMYERPLGDNLAPADLHGLIKQPVCILAAATQDASPALRISLWTPPTLALRLISLREKFRESLTLSLSYSFFFQAFCRLLLKDDKEDNKTLFNDVFMKKKTRESVFTFARNRCSRSLGIGVHVRSESVFTARNRCSHSLGWRVFNFLKNLKSLFSLSFSFS